MMNKEIMFTSVGTDVHVVGPLVRTSVAMIEPRGGLGHYRATYPFAPGDRPRARNRSVERTPPNAPGRDRTSDPLLRRQPLYPLSYGGSP